MTEIAKKKSRSSNIELYRILVMLLIIAHHYVVNSGLISPDGPVLSNPTSPNSIFYLLVGMWGKTGINCFVLITGFFMCMSSISLKKYLKLYLEVKFIRCVILIVFIVVGMTSFSFAQMIRMILPFSSITDSFTNSYMAFFLFIPFLNIVVKGMNKSMHRVLVVLTLIIYSGFYQLPGFHISFNYLSWFIILYFVSSYIRLYGLWKNDSVVVWAFFFMLSMIVSMMSVLVCIKLECWPYIFVGESLSLMSVASAICSFMFFKNLKMGHSRAVNLFASTTFGVFLIHTSGQEMRDWLWITFLNNVGNYATPHYILYTLGCIVGVFAVCSILDLLRMFFFEKPVFMFLDKKFGKRDFYNGRFFQNGNVK